MRNTVIGVTLAILIAAGLGVGYLANSSGNSHPETTTSTFTPTSQQNTTSIITMTSMTTFSMSVGQPIPVATVETGNFSLPGGLAYVLDSSTDRMFILGTSSLAVVDMPSGSVIANITLPANNTGGLINAGLAVDPSTGTVYASVQGEVVEVNGSTDTIVRELPLNFGTLAFEPTTHMLWGTQPGHWALVEVDPLTGSVVANVSIGFSPFDIAVDPGTGLVYSDGCHQEGLVCFSWASIVNGTSGTPVAKVALGSGDYPTMALDPETHVLYVSGEQQLAAINGTTGAVIFNVNPQTCGPFVNIVVDPSLNLVLTAPATGYNYLLAYDGATGNLVDMYSFSSTPAPIALNPSNGQLYLWTTAGPFLSIRLLSTTGNVNSTLIGGGEACGLP
jgi:hypothetical protein